MITAAVSTNLSVTDLKAGRSPFFAGLMAFLEFMGTAFARDERNPHEGTVLIAADMARHLGFPQTPDDPMPVLETARALGWKVGETLHPFVTFRGHRSFPAIHIGVLPWIERERNRYPLVEPKDPFASTSLMAQWNERTGSAYRGEPMVNGAAILRDTAPPGKSCPTWKPKDEIPVSHRCERPYTPHDLSLRTARIYDGPVTAVDQFKAYLCAMISGNYPKYGLRHTGLKKFDPKEYGYWRVRLPVWNDPRLPNPAGYSAAPDDDRWVTTPTLRLLTEVMAQGECGPFEVLDSWTSKGAQVFRPMAERLRDILHDYDCDPRLRTTAALSYQNLHGFLVPTTGTVSRPEWYASIIAEHRTMMWRRMWRAGRTENKFPLSVNVDCAYYPEDGVPTGKNFPRPLVVDKEMLGEFTFTEYNTLNDALGVAA